MNVLETDADGWAVKWPHDGTGSGYPAGLDPKALVMYRLDNEPAEYGPDRIRDLNWRNRDEPGTITSWRRVEPVVEIAVGDVNGTTKGSGARANGGKPAVELIPAGVIAAYLHYAYQYPPWETVSKPKVTSALQDLGAFQMRSPSRDARNALLHALLSLNPDGNLWVETARVFDYGRHKYSAWNWARGMAWSIPIGCGIRHLLAMVNDPAAVDPESKEPHRGHVGCNIVMLLWFLEYYPEGDDRPKLPSA